MRSISPEMSDDIRIAIRPRACCTRAASSATSGTTRFAASVGVEARRSATRSSSGLSASWPIALTSGVDAGRGGTHELLVAEHQQVLEVAAAAGDDDHVDLRVGIELADGGRHLARGAVALHRGVLHPERHLRPAQLGVAQHVLLGIRVLAGDETDALGEERQRLLAVGVEQPLGTQSVCLQPLELGEQVADAGMPQIGGHHREGAAAHPVVGLHERHHPVALGELLGEALHRRRPHGERHRDVLVEVFELRVDDAAARCSTA